MGRDWQDLLVGIFLVVWVFMKYCWGLATYPVPSGKYCPEKNPTHVLMLYCKVANLYIIIKIYLHQQQSNLINQMMLELIGCEF